ncbi:MAG: 50S ribosomal protein L23 [Candidatus Omnitrophota bacterium]
MKTPYDTTLSLLRTEKGSILLPENKYIFLVNIKANKVQIKKSIEQIYKVKVAKINTAIMPGKLKRVRFQVGHTSEWKKAVVTLKEGHKIEVT